MQAADLEARRQRLVSDDLPRLADQMSREQLRLESVNTQILNHKTAQALKRTEQRIQQFSETVFQLV